MKRPGFICFISTLIAGLAAAQSATAPSKPPPIPSPSAAQLNLEKKTFVLGDRVAFQVNDSDIDDVFQKTPDGKPVARLRKMGAKPFPRIKITEVRLWLDRQWVNVELISVREASTAGKHEITLLLLLPAELSTDTYDATKMKDAVSRRIALMQKWSAFGLFGRTLPVTIELKAECVNENGALVEAKEVAYNGDGVIRTVPYGVAAIVPLLVGLAIFLAIYAARTTRMMFDPNPASYTDPTTNVVTWRWQYSLARVQGLTWLIVVFFASLFVYAVSGSLLGVMNPTALGLLAIGCGTSFVGLLIEQTQPPPPTPPAAAPPVAAARPKVSQLLDDVLDSNGGGNLHRLQIVIWTIALVVVYVHRLFETYQLPAFDETTFGLMGVSAATYLGFKAREK